MTRLLALWHHGSHGYLVGAGLLLLVSYLMLMLRATTSRRVLDRSRDIWIEPDPREEPRTVRQWLRDNLTVEITHDNRRNRDDQDPKL